VKAIKSDSDSDSDEQKRSPGISGKNRGVTPSVAAPGVTHPSDAAADSRPKLKIHLTQPGTIFHRKKSPPVIT